MRDNVKENLIKTGMNFHWRGSKLTKFDRLIVCTRHFVDGFNSYIFRYEFEPFFSKIVYRLLTMNFASPPTTRDLLGHCDQASRTATVWERREILFCAFLSAPFRRARCNTHNTQVSRLGRDWTRPGIGCSRTSTDSRYTHKKKFQIQNWKHNSVILLSSIQRV